MKKLALPLVFIATACRPPVHDELHSHAPAGLYHEEIPYSSGVIATSLLCDVSGENNACVVDIDDMPYANTRPCAKAVEGKPRIMTRITRKFHVSALGDVSRPVVKEKACPTGFEREDVAKGMFNLEVKAIKDTLESMSESGIIWRLPNTVIVMETDDADMRNALALAALQSDEWQRSYGPLHLTNTIEERADKKHFKDMNALVSKLLLSTDAFMPLEAMLKEDNFKIKKLEVNQVETAKFSTLPISAPQAEEENEVYVPVHAYYSITLEKIH